MPSIIAVDTSKSEICSVMNIDIHDEIHTTGKVWIHKFLRLLDLTKTTILQFVFHHVYQQLHYLCCSELHGLFYWQLKLKMCKVLMHKDRY